MANLLAIIAKAQFETSHPDAREGDALELDRYISTNAALTGLKAGGSLFLVTVRPPDERLWLVGELVDPKHDGKAWRSAPSKLAVRDVTALISELKFTTGKGLAPKKGALGMSLQTPRQLTDEDVALLRGKATKERPAPSPATPAAEPLALSDVIDEWRQTRAPELETLIDTLSKHHARAWPALDPEADDYDAQWKARATQLCPENLATLLPGLWNDPVGAIPLRLRKLLDHGSDPRLGEALLTMIDEPPFTASSNFPAWTQLFKALPDVVDTRATKRLEARKKKKGGESQFWPKFAGWISRAIDDLPAPAELSKTQAASVAKRQKHAEKLLAGPTPVAAAPPKPDAPRTLLAGTTAALEAAVAHAEAGRVLDVLEPLRQAWEHSRSPEIAQLVESFAKAGAVPFTEEGKPDAFHERWLAAAKPFDAKLVTPLLATLLKGTLVLTEHRLESMLAWPPDPRVARCVIERLIFGRDPYIGARPNLWSRAYDLLVTHADPRFAEKVRANAERLTNAVNFDRNRAERPHAVRTLQPYLDRLANPTPLLANDSKLLTKLEQLAARATASKKSEQQPDKALGLLLAINAAPDDPSPRLVYADFLAERGDPRAEFINLAVALSRGEKVKSAHDACARKLGIFKQLSNYHLGLPVKERVDEYKVVTDLDAFVDDPKWVTIRELQVKYHPNAVDSPAATRLIEKGQLYGLRSLVVGGAMLGLAANRDFPWALERIELADFELPDSLRAEAFPKLECLGLTMFVPLPPTLFQHPLFAKVRRVELGTSNQHGELPVDVLLMASAQLPKLERITATNASFSFELSGGELRVGVKPGMPRIDPWDVATLERLKKVSPVVVRSCVVEAAAGVPPERLTAVKSATAHFAT
ncbi:MAG: TIGR02996 domain-containing protein [Archangiaceae bacterium]|nr:TIGR02996 domain-containing protein [Archangiaceae bacterium]